MAYGVDLTLAILRECQEFEDAKSSRTQTVRFARENGAAVAQNRRAPRGEGKTTELQRRISVVLTIKSFP
ncbi:hypothetical protein [Bosea psychrotolerans]|uniref:Uncharacterized protein n=1 Tax=Bosea psychrotolerans TaxID=1871628 RepID=A0A2S4MHI2_9HYPH|nr:hypothetical protein [Bosea psychrotolerans]POR54213.1 hypothetical protein CYD53_103316 [Bosea psychrotolerans]